MTSLRDTPKPAPIEIWLSKKNIAITCMVVFDDESTDELDVESLSMRGAQREITGWLVAQGYKPVGRWDTEQTDAEGDALETTRTFKIERTLDRAPGADQLRSTLDSSDTPLTLKSQA